MELKIAHSNRPAALQRLLPPIRVEPGHDVREGVTDKVDGAPEGVPVRTGRDAGRTPVAVVDGAAPGFEGVFGQDCRLGEVSVAVGLGEDVGGSGEVGVKVVPHGGGEFVGGVGFVGFGRVVWVLGGEVVPDEDAVVVGGGVGGGGVLEEADGVGRTGHRVG